MKSFKTISKQEQFKTKIEEIAKLISDKLKCANISGS